MNQEIERKRNFIINTVYLTICLAIYYLMFRYVIYAVLPFTIALLVTVFLRPPVNFICKKLKLPKKGVAIVFVALFYAAVAAALVFLIALLASASTNIINSIPEFWNDKMVPLMRDLFSWYETKIGSANPQIAAYVESISNDLIANLGSLVTGLTGKLINFAQTTVTGLPGMVISVIFCVIATVFLSSDYTDVSYFIMNQFSPRTRQMIVDVKYFLGHTIIRMLLSYGLIMCITWAELMIGLRLCGVEDVNTLAVVIAVFDILPALGTGGIMLPWSVICLVKGNVSLGIKLLILYGVITVIRNIIEPKIVGQTIGLHPVLMLMSIFMGATIFGVFGIIIVPFTLIIIRKLNDEGYIHLFKSVYYDDDFDAKTGKRKEKNDPSEEIVEAVKATEGGNE